MLTRYSADLEKDWRFRLSLSTIAMTIPFFAAIALAMKARRTGPFSLSAKMGLLVAILSLGLAASPIRDGLLRAKQTRNMAMHDVAAPRFDTVDINGNAERLSDQAGKVVIVNVWATWCGPCRSEMPKLDHLYRERKDKGLVVFGISDEDVGVQRKYLQQVPVRHDFLWSRSEKVIARKAFDAALKRELHELIQEAKQMASRIQQPSDLWDLEHYLTERRKQINRTYDYRYSQLTLVFGKLLCQSWLGEEELRGLGEDKLKSIRSYAKFLAEMAAA
jgi:thiol-disulfide isomerase/thioredoxin